MFRVLQQIIRSVHTTRSSKRFVKQNYLQFYLHFNFMLFKIVCACGFVSPTRQIVVVASLDASFCFGSFFCRWWRQLMLSFRCLTRETRLAAGASRWNRQCCRPAHKNALCCCLIKLVTNISVVTFKILFRLPTYVWTFIYFSVRISNFGLIIF